MSLHQSARTARTIATLLALLLVTACQPHDRTPGQWLRGTPVATPPDDWSFTDSHAEIFVEVATPYFIPHSVTIWCAQVNGDLYIGARDPHTKRWPGWVDRNPDIRLKIGDELYEVTAAPLSGESTLEPVRSAYARKYDLAPPTAGAAPEVRYWAIVPRA